MKEKILNIPNLITFTRLFIFTPLIVISILNNNMFNAIILLVLTFLADGIDGNFARKFHQETIFGKYFDLLADGLITLSIFISLILVGLLEAAVILLLGISFFIMTVANLYPLKKIGKTLPTKTRLKYIYAFIYVAFVLVMLDLKYGDFFILIISIIYFIIVLLYAKEVYLKLKK